MVVEEEGGERSSGADIISAVRGSRVVDQLARGRSSAVGEMQLNVSQPAPAQAKACAVLVRLGGDWTRALVLLACWLVLFTSVVPCLVA